MRLGALWAWIAVGVSLSSCGDVADDTPPPESAGSTNEPAATGASGGTAAHAGAKAGRGGTSAGRGGATTGHGGSRATTVDTPGGGGPIPDGSLSPGGVAGIDASFDPAGSGGQAGNSSPSGPTPVDPALLDAQANADLMGRLDYLVGRFVHGDVPVYRGQMSAHDNAGDVFSNQTDGVIPDGPAVATLVEVPLEGTFFSPYDVGVTGTGAFLDLHGLGTDLDLFLEQSAGDAVATRATFIGSPTETLALMNSCNNCVPSLWHQPASIEFGEIDASSAAGTGHVLVSASLTPAPPSTLTFDELLEVSGRIIPSDASFGLGEFTRSGNEMVKHVRGEVDTPNTDPAFPSGGADYGCFVETDYTADIYVNLDDPSDYGVQNLTFDGPVETCGI
jgi:hypothetical protein